MAVNEHERLSNITHEHKLSEKIKGTKFWLLLYIWQYGLQQWAYMIDWLIGWCLMSTLAIFQLYRGVTKFIINLDTYKTIRNKR